MNMFVLDTDPYLCATYHCDKHIVKMPLETAQVACTVLQEHGIDAKYRATHKHHPLVKWAGASYYNYSFLLELGVALCEEYSYRYGRIHACQSVINECRCSMPQLKGVLPLGFTEIPQCMPDYCKIPNDPVAAYRQYYMLEKRGIATWNKNRPTPSWYIVTN